MHSMKIVIIEVNRDWVGKKAILINYKFPLYIVIHVFLPLLRCTSVPLLMRTIYKRATTQKSDEVAHTTTS